MSAPSTAAVIYARVSTVEQGENYSLPTQVEGCRAYAEAHRYAVAGVIREMTAFEQERAAVFFDEGGAGGLDFFEGSAGMAGEDSQFVEVGGDDSSEGEEELAVGGDGTGAE